MSDDAYTYTPDFDSERHRELVFDKPLPPPSTCSWTVTWDLSHFGKRYWFFMCDCGVGDDQAKYGHYGDDGRAAAVAEGERHAPGAGPQERTTQ